MLRLGSDARSPTIFCLTGHTSLGPRGWKECSYQLPNSWVACTWRFWLLLLIFRIAVNKFFAGGRRTVVLIMLDFNFGMGTFTWLLLSLIAGLIFSLILCYAFRFVWGFSFFYHFQYCAVFSGMFDAFHFLKTYKRRPRGVLVGTHSLRRSGTLRGCPVGSELICQQLRFRYPIQLNAHHYQIAPSTTSWVLAAWSVADFSVFDVCHLDASPSIGRPGGP